MGFMDRFKKKIPGAPSASTPTSEVKVDKPAKVVKDAPKSEAVVKPATKTTTAHRIIIRPLVTEKAAAMQSTNKYAFVVAHGASKTQVKFAIKELYGVEPLSVNVINVEGKSMRFGRTMGRRSNFKKAIVTVPKGTNITVHEGV